MQNCDFAGIPRVPDNQLWDQLHATEEVEWANQRAKEVRDKVNKMEDRMQLAKTKVGALQDPKHALEQQLAQQMEEKKEEPDKIEELDVCIHMQDEHYANQIAQLVLEKSEMHTKYEQHKAQLDLEKNEQTKK